MLSFKSARRFDAITTAADAAAKLSGDASPTLALYAAVSRPETISELSDRDAVNLRRLVIAIGRELPGLLPYGLADRIDDVAKERDDAAAGLLIDAAIIAIEADSAPAGAPR